MRMHILPLLAFSAVSLLIGAEGQIKGPAADFAGSSGLIVYAGCGAGDRLPALAGGNTNTLVFGLDTDPAHVDAAREQLLAAGVYGRISVDRYDGKTLPFLENTVNFLIVENTEGVSKEEALRVLAPRGTALWKGEKLTKPVPGDIDEWSHFDHGPEGNPVANDLVVGPPRRLQWVAGPSWLRSHEVPSGITSMVTAGGRLFYTLDEGPIGIVDGRFPEKWVVVARDAFNGVQLWKIPLPQWGWQTFKPEWKTADMTELYGLRTHGPKQYRYLMAADAERVYLPLGKSAPVSCIDAATGKAVAICNGSEDAMKLVVSEGILLVMKERGSVVAYDAESGRELWTRSGVASMAADGKQAVFSLSNKKLVAVDLRSGKEAWSTDAQLSGDIMLAEGKALILGKKKLSLHSCKDGQELWSKQCNPGKFGTYIIGKTIWLDYEGRRISLDTGEALPDPDVKGLWSTQHHHRCYTDKATDRYIIGSMEGMEFLAVDGSSEHSRNNWVRGACTVGILPANGLTYAPPDQCFCSPGVKELGFTALAAEAPTPHGLTAGPRLEKGPAFGDVDGSCGEADWPSYRHDVLLSGSTKLDASADRKVAWRLKLGGKLTQPVVGGKRVFVASSDTHTLHAIDLDTGKACWRFTAGGRIDSPPTLWKGALLFGSADGWVYCLRRSDGQLAWRFRAAPGIQRIQSFGQLESVWPLPGAVALLNNVAYVSAGRSTYLDGGLYLYGLDPATGKVLCKHRESSPNENQENGTGHSFWSEGARNDVLTSDGEFLYVKQLRFDRELKPVPAETKSLLGDRQLGRRLVSTSGLLDDSWYNRAFWMYSTIWPGYYLANQASKSGQLLVFDDKTTWGVNAFWTRNRHSPMFFPQTHGYLVFADDNDNEPILVGRDEGKALTWLPEFNMSAGGKGKRDASTPKLGSAPPASDVNAYAYNKDKGIGFTRTRPPLWSEWVPIRVQAMVKTKDKLFLAGAPDVLDPTDPLGALEGRKGGVLQVLTAADGKKLAEYPLDAPPVLDGMIYAGNRLLIADWDGVLTAR